MTNRPPARVLLWKAITANGAIPGLVLVIAVSAFARLYRLESVPGNLTADETDFFRDVYTVLYGRGLGWFYQGQMATLLPLGILPMSWLVDLLGNSFLALRMYSVTLSLAVVVLFFMFVRYRFSLTAAVAASVLLSTNVWFLNFSRTAWPNMNAAFLALALVASLTLALSERRSKWFVAVGIVIGLAPWAYFSARLLPLVAGLSLPVAMRFYGQYWRTLLKGYALAAIIAMIVAAPVLIKISNNAFWNQYIFRAKAVSVFSEENRHGKSEWSVVLDNARRTTEGFLLLSNHDPIIGTQNLFRNSTEGVRYAPRGGQLFDVLSRLLFWVGLAASLGRLRITFLWWLVFLVALSTQIFSVGAPDAARGLMVVPVIFLFVALGLETVLSLVFYLVKTTGRGQMSAIAVGVGIFLVALTGGRNVDAYFDWMQEDYALRDRGPMVWRDEFAEWSDLQIKAASQGRSGFNTGQWRERQDEAGCLTGFLRDGACTDFSVSPDSGSFPLVQPADLAQEFRQVASMGLPGRRFADFFSSRNDTLKRETTSVDVEEAWISVYYSPAAVLVSATGRLSDQSDAAGLVQLKASLKGDAYLGGPKLTVAESRVCGSQAILLSFHFSDMAWTQFVCQVGSYIVQVQVVYPVRSQETTDSGAIITRLGQETVRRIEASVDTR